MSIKNALRGNLTDWLGLSGSETKEVIDDALRPWQRVRDPEEKTRQTQRYTMIAYERTVKPYLIEVWYLYGNEYVALIEYDDPTVQDFEHTLELLGQPELLLENKRYKAGAIVKECVYASRGITLSIAEPIVKTCVSKKKVIHLQLYPATSVQYYVTDIGSGSELRPYPYIVDQENDKRAKS